MRAHPAAELFPMMSESALQGLADNIRAHGLQHPIVTAERDGECVILDGRNRFHACEMAGVRPTLVAFAGEDPIAYVASSNLHRRDLDKSQKAMLALELEKLYAEEAARKQAAAGAHGAEGGRGRVKENPSGTSAQRVSESDSMRAREQAARAVGVSGRLVQDAKRVAASAPPEVVAAVRAGEMTVTAAVRTLGPDESPLPREAFMRNGAPAKPVSDGVVRVKHPNEGAPKAPHPNKNIERHEVVARLFKQGFTVADIAEQTGVPKEAIHSILQPLRPKQRTLERLIADTQVIGESWVSRSRDERVLGAPSEERDELIEQLEFCRKAALRLIHQLKKDVVPEAP